MGMRCKAMGVESKIGGLLGRAIIEAAEADPQMFPRVELEDHLISGGFCALNRDGVQRVLQVMRFHLLDGWARRANSWNGSTPLANLQDILHFVADVDAFGQLASWLAWGDGDELSWS
jgi:hypothetical protein